MRKIINIKTKEEIELKRENLPMMIHGKEHSGASLFSVVVVAGLHDAGNKLLIYTAYPMAKEEFLSQIETKDNVFYLEDEKDLEKALLFQTIFIASGNIDLFTKVITNYYVSDRVIFIKNIDTIQIPLYNIISSFRLLLSGDFESNPIQKALTDIPYKTKIFFSSLGGEVLPFLQKYHAYIKTNVVEDIIVTLLD